MTIPQSFQNIKPNLTTFIICFFLLDVLSSLAYFVAPLRNIVFGLLVIAIFLLTLYRFEYGFLTAVAELFLGSKGYLFFFESGETVISLRIAIFIILMSVYFVKSFVLLHRHGIRSFPRDARMPYLLFFLATIFFGLAKGIQRGYGVANIFLDGNAYFYTFLFFPAFYLVNKLEGKNILKDLLPRIAVIAALWLSVKTIILFSFFRYAGGSELARSIYRWVRNTVGEITKANDNIFRIFIQSQIYVLIILVAVLVIFASKEMNKKRLILYTACGSIFFTALLVSMSRSFWVGGLAAGAAYIFVQAIKNKWRTIGRFIVGGVLCGLGALLIIFLINAPALGGVKTRATEFAESAVSSREAQFLPLIGEIKKSPWLGHGFGKTVTYKSSDPRILASNPAGVYTTYAFELGYLDILLKIGAVGLLLYLLLMVKIGRGLVRAHTPLAEGLLYGLIALVVTHAFSPYLNHPLGIGYLVLASLYRYHED